MRRCDAEDLRMRRPRVRLILLDPSSGRQSVGLPGIAQGRHTESAGPSAPSRSWDPGEVITSLPWGQLVVRGVTVRGDLLVDRGEVLCQGGLAPGCGRRGGVGMA